MTDTSLINNGPLPEAGEAGAEIMARADAIAAFNEGARGVTRRFLTSEHRAAAEMIMGWMRDAGMDAVRLDNAGNVVGRYEAGSGRRTRRSYRRRGASGPGTSR